MYGSFSRLNYPCINYTAIPSLYDWAAYMWKFCIRILKVVSRILWWLSIHYLHKECFKHTPLSKMSPVVLGKTKHYFRRNNKPHKKTRHSHMIRCWNVCKYLCIKITKTRKTVYCLCQTYKPTVIQKLDQHTGGKWLIHGTKHRKDNHLQNLKLVCKYSSWEYKSESDDNKPNPPF